jgi:DNA-binding HxlR family transcriptional regulator
MLNLPAMKTKTQRGRRSGCPINVVLETVGDSWSLLIVRDLMFKEKKTFNEFQNAEEKIATNILSDRLQRLDHAGIVIKQSNLNDARRYIYRLTEKGIDLAPMLIEMFLWAARHEKTAASPAVIREMTRNREAFIADLRSRWKNGRREATRPLRA